MLPNFLGIGAQRAGTTWLYNCLNEHPDVFVSSEKEIHFFSHKFERGVAWYEEYFQGRTTESAVGEITPNYLNVPAAIPRIAEVAPDTNLLVILREPLDRARSAYRLLRETKYPGVDFAEACGDNSYLVRLSLYSEQMQRVFTHFPRQQVFVALYDDVQRDPRAFLLELFDFLGVDRNFLPPSMQERYNQVLYPRVQQFINKFGLGPALEASKNTAAGRWAKRLHSNVQHGQPRASALDDMSSGLREMFRADLVRLEKIIERDLSCWLRSYEAK